MLLDNWARIWYHNLQSAASSMVRLILLELAKSGQFVSKSSERPADRPFYK